MKNTEEGIEKTKLMDTGPWVGPLFGFIIGILIVAGTGNWYLGGAAWLTIFLILDVLIDIADYQIKIIKELREMKEKIKE
ncbi:MAG TPA: hypothetical protein VIH31_00610 [Candidatus Paceibacterota bacterium]